MHSEQPEVARLIKETRVALADLSTRGLERRRYPRVDLSLEGFIGAAEQSLPAECMNLSAGGALLRLETIQVVPETFVLHLVFPVFGDLPVPVLARRIEVAGRRVRLSFDPLPGPIARVVLRQMVQAARIDRSCLKFN
jgi:hypothetical protein